MSVTINGTVFSGLTYTDCASDFWELPGAKLSVDPYGMDSITRRYQGRLDRVATEVAKYKRDRKKKDSIYNWLYYVTLDVTENAQFAELSVNYKGLYDGKIPEPVISDSGYRRNTVELGIAENIGLTVLGGSTTITYNSPFVKVNFVSKTRRKWAQHANLLDATQLQIIKQTSAQAAALNIVKGQSLNGQPNQSVQQIAGVVGSYNGTMEVQSSITSQKPVGQWWEGTETHELLIMPMEARIHALQML